MASQPSNMPTDPEQYTVEDETHADVVHMALVTANVGVESTNRKFDPVIETVKEAVEGRLI